MQKRALILILALCLGVCTPFAATAATPQPDLVPLASRLEQAKENRKNYEKENQDSQKSSQNSKTQPDASAGNSGKKSTATSKKPQNAKKQLLSAKSSFGSIMSQHTIQYPNEKAAETLRTWLVLVEHIIDQVEISYDQAIDAYDHGNDQWESQYGSYISTTATASQLEYTLIGMLSYRSDPSPYLMGEYTAYDRKKDVVQTDCFFLNTEGERGDVTSYIDAVRGKKGMYIQQIDYSHQRDRAGMKDCYTATRIMLRDGKIYASMRYMTLAQADKARLNSTFPNFASFQYEDSALFIYDGKKMVCQDASGEKIEFPLQKNGQSGDAPDSSKKDKDSGKKNQAVHL